MHFLVCLEKQYKEIKQKLASQRSVQNMKEQDDKFTLICKYKECDNAEIGRTQELTTHDSFVPECNFLPFFDHQIKFETDSARPMLVVTVCQDAI